MDLEVKLEQRSSASELEAKGILQSASMAPSLQATAKELESHLIKDKVGHLLQKRVDVDTLEQTGVRRLESRKISMLLQPVQDELEKKLKRSQLFHALRQRPTMTEVVSRGIREPSPSVSRVALEAKRKQEEQEVLRLQRVNYESSCGEQAIIEGGLKAFIRSENFVYIRILLKFAANLHEVGDISRLQKAHLKEMIVAENPVVMKAAKAFDQSSDVLKFRTTLKRLVSHV